MLDVIAELKRVKFLSDGRFSIILVLAFGVGCASFAWIRSMAYAEIIVE